MLNNNLVQLPPYDQIWLNSFYCLFFCLYFYSYTTGNGSRDRIFSIVFCYGVSPPVLFVAFILRQGLTTLPRLVLNLHLTFQFSFLGLPCKYFWRPTNCPLSDQTVDIINVKWLSQGYRAARLFFHGSILSLKSPQSWLHMQSEDIQSAW